MAHRRRGEELEAALLEAAWAQLVEQGYAALTFDAVAQRAGTSRPVLYRRWATKPDLVRAAVQHVTRREDVTLPDTGSLREDMVAIMRLGNQRRMAMSALLAYYLGPYFQETGTSPQDLRTLLLGDGRTMVEIIVDRAVARGEVDPARLTARRRTLAFDLLRHEALMTLAPVSDEVIDEIVDDIFMPLVAG